VVSISAYLNEWFNVTKSIVTQPRRFFREMPESGSFREPFEYLLITIIIASLLTIPIILLVLADSLAEISLVSIILISLVVFVFSIISMVMSLPVYVLIYHFLLKICGAKGNLEATLKVFSYYLSTSTIVIPIFGVLIMLLYIVDKSGLQGGVLGTISSVLLLLIALVIVCFTYYVLLAGFAEVHGMSMKRVIFAVLGIPTAAFMALMVIPMIFVFSSGFSEETFDLPAESTITAPYGSAPIVDGYHTPEDQWYETQKVHLQTDDVIYTMAAKHDNENLYILINWNDEPEWKNSITMYFEQDGQSHDHNLETGRVDCKSNGADVYGPGNLVDSDYNSDVREMQDGIVAGNYSGGFWTQEWAIPLQSDEQVDINVKQLPATLGFVITDTGTRIVWPARASLSRPETWGNLEIVQ
jgi:hypothetical protein